MNPCEPYPDDASFKTIGLEPCPDCGTDECWAHYQRWERRFLGNPHDDWAATQVQSHAWLHIALTTHRGYTMVSGGRAWCGQCEWKASARSDDSDEARGRFALLCLAALGLAVSQAVDKGGQLADTSS